MSCFGDLAINAYVLGDDHAARAYVEKFDPRRFEENPDLEAISLFLYDRILDQDPTTAANAYLTFAGSYEWKTSDGRRERAEHRLQQIGRSLLDRFDYDNETVEKLAAYASDRIAPAREPGYQQFLFDPERL